MPAGGSTRRTGARNGSVVSIRKRDADEEPDGSNQLISTRPKTSSQTRNTSTPANTWMKPTAGV
jgi:hypothetical protein